MLNLTKSEDCTKLVLSSDELTRSFEEVNNNLSITITVELNCCSTYELVIERDDVGTPFELTTDDYTYDTTANTLSLNAQELLGNSIFFDGVYKVSIQYRDEEGSGLIEENCFFLDCETNCKVATKLEELINDDTDIHLLHYGLVAAGNCGCNCEEMCELFRKLNALLGDETKCM